ncbi:MAG: hypothetical protein QM817_18565 [Archangium sp.]
MVTLRVYSMACGGSSFSRMRASRSAIGGPFFNVTAKSVSSAPFTNTGYQRSGQPTLSTPDTAASAKAPSASAIHNR